MRYDTEEHGDKGRVRHGSPTFYNLLHEMAETHDRKSHDYTSNTNPAGNYHFAGQMALLFAHSPEDAGFIGRIAEKVYRLANLSREGKEPKNETVADTERDIAVITALWMADRRNRRSMQTNQAMDRRLSEAELISQDACLKVIPLVEMLTTQDIFQMRDYLNGILRDRNGALPEDSAKFRQGRSDDSKRL